MYRTLSQHISNNYQELDNGTISPQRRRHLQDQLIDLEIYQKNHPNDDYDPNPLELYCDINPNALECKIYDD
jgi:hypothetical protein